MKDITANEVVFLLRLFKNPKTEYNANSIAKEMEISSMGALKIAKKLEKEKLIISKQLGKAKFYRLNQNSEYTTRCLQFLLRREAEHSPAYVKRWINEVRKIKNADGAILFGSVLVKQEQANDIDILLITDNKRTIKLKKEIEKINQLNVKKIHPLYQSREDLKKNILKEDKVILNAIKGIVIFGEDELIELIEK